MAEIDFTSAWHLDNALFIDLRSPDEFHIDHIPGAINLPIFNDEERKEIGTLYCQINPIKAGYRGLEVVLPKVSGLLKQIEELTKTNQVILYCWRGGQRSKSLYMLAQAMQLDCHYLCGGYKAYRNHVVKYFKEECPFSIFVLHGLTGVGKTEILQKIKNETSMQVIDFEGLLNNRGSAFGTIGLKEPPTQKVFESSLWLDLDKFDRDRPVLVECESRRLGNNLIPDTLFQGMKTGRNILLYDNVENRTTRILKDYHPAKHLKEIVESILLLKTKITEKQINKLINEAKTGNFSYIVEHLLIDYYDPLYGYPDQPVADYELCVDTNNGAEAVKKIVSFFDHAG